MEHIISQDGPVWQGARRGYGQLMRLAGSMLRIGAIGFGGGNALIPVIEAEVVQRGQLVTKRDYEEDVIAACITPGALPVEIAAGIGQRLGGFPGMLLAAAMMALPGALLTVLILSVLTGEQGAALQGIRYQYRDGQQLALAVRLRFPADNGGGGHLPLCHPLPPFAAGFAHVAGGRQRSVCGTDRSAGQYVMIGDNIF